MTDGLHVGMKESSLVSVWMTDYRTLQRFQLRRFSQKRQKRKAVLTGQLEFNLGGLTELQRNEQNWGDYKNKTQNTNIIFIVVSLAQKNVL